MRSNDGNISPQVRHDGEKTRVQVTVRLDARDKRTIAEAAEAIGLEPGTAARQIVELVCQRLRAGADLLDVLQHLKQKPVIRIQAGSGP